MVVPAPHLSQLQHLPANMTLVSNPHKRRRTATAVMAGLFDPQPPRYVLTSVLNQGGSAGNSLTGSEMEKGSREKARDVDGEMDEQERAKKRQERKDQKKADKKLAKQMLRAKEKEMRQQHQGARAGSVGAGSSSGFPSASAPPGASGSNSNSNDASSSSQWRTIARPTIHIPAQPSASVTPSPTSSPRRMASTPGTTPGPSISSSTSRTSSKRPYTPDLDSVRGGKRAMGAGSSLTAPPERPRERKKRQAAKKGWKGWVEGSPPPSEKLINLDSAPVLQERRLRSGKAFDGVGPGGMGAS